MLLKLKESIVQFYKKRTEVLRYNLQFSLFKLKDSREKQIKFLLRLILLFFFFLNISGNNYNLYECAFVYVCMYIVELQKDIILSENY